MLQIYCFVLVALTASLKANLGSFSEEKSHCSAATFCPSNIEESGVRKMTAKNERTFLAVKPDGVQRGLVGEVLKRFEQRGYKLVGMKMLHADEKLLTEHYKEHIGKPFFKTLLNYMNSGPVVAMVFEGTSIVSAARKMLGATKPLESAPGTIRGDFCIDTGRNLVHASDSVEVSKREIQLWFRSNELYDWQHTVSTWIYE